MLSELHKSRFEGFLPLWACRRVSVVALRDALRATQVKVWGFFLPLWACRRVSVVALRDGTWQTLTPSCMPRGPPPPLSVDKLAFQGVLFSETGVWEQTRGLVSCKASPWWFEGGFCQIPWLKPWDLIHSFIQWGSISSPSSCLFNYLILTLWLV